MIEKVYFLISAIFTLLFYLPENTMLLAENIFSANIDRQEVKNYFLSEL